MNEYRWADLTIGLKEQLTVSVSSGDIQQFSRLCGDENPLHTNRSYAESRGYRDLVAHGMLTSSFYSTLVGTRLPGKHCLLHGIDIRFVKPVLAGDVLTIVGEISYLNEACHQAEIRAYILNAAGEKVSTAKIKVGTLE